MLRPLVVFAVLAGSRLLWGQLPAPLTGVVTAIESPSSIRLDSQRISLTPTTRVCIERRNGSTLEDRCSNNLSEQPTSFYLGQPLQVAGPIDHHVMTASRVVILDRSAGSLDGIAIIDRIPDAQPRDPKERIVRADGYLLHITPETRLSLPSPLNSLSDVTTNQWIQYTGTQQPDGRVKLKAAIISSNGTSKTETKVRKKTEYDPAKVPDDAHQSGLSKAFLGTDFKRVPPWHDTGMQARVDRIGNSLIPAYQRALPSDDPTKINFRFQVIDRKKIRDAINLPSGVIVVPYQVVERMQTDDELATVLADNIAEALEEDTLHAIDTAKRAGAANIAGDVAGLFIPGVGLATNIATSSAMSHMMSLQLQQSGRVSLCLLHDAGYDIHQAPLAWWHLAGKPGKSLGQTRIPPRAATLYTMLGTTWHTSSPNPHPVQ